jgi:hypothetical protein
MKVPEVPLGSGRFREFRCRCQVKVAEVVEGSGGFQWVSGRFGADAS